MKCILMKIPPYFKNTLNTKYLISPIYCFSFVVTFFASSLLLK